MATMKFARHAIFVMMSIAVVSMVVSAKSPLVDNYYAKLCPNVNQIMKEQVYALYKEHGNTAVSWLRLIFHDCGVERCDASVLLDDAPGISSEKKSDRNFGMRNFKYIEVIKKALENECPGVVSCADIIALAASEGIAVLGGPKIPLKTGRKDSRMSSSGVVDQYIPHHSDSIDTVLARFEAMGIDNVGSVALLGAHTVGRTHCVNLVERLYPSIDPTLNTTYGEYLKVRCPTAHPPTEGVHYSRNDRGTPMKFDNNYFKNVVAHKGLLHVDQNLLSHPKTGAYVVKMAEDNDYFFKEFSRALTILSENNPLTDNEGEVRKTCKFVN